MNEVPFLWAMCTRLLNRPAFCEFISWKAALPRPHCPVYAHVCVCASARVCACVCDYVLKHMSARRGRHSSSWGRRRHRGMCAADGSVMLLLLSVIVLCIGFNARMCNRSNWSKGWESPCPLSSSANTNEGGSDVDERLFNLIPLPKAYGFIMGHIKLI